MKTTMIAVWESDAKKRWVKKVGLGKEEVDCHDRRYHVNYDTVQDGMMCSEDRPAPHSWWVALLERESGIYEVEEAYGVDRKGNRVVVADWRNEEFRWVKLKWRF
jgi:hypothetical protein